MDGTAELVQLAHLLRVGAAATRDIAVLRPDDVARLEQLAAEAEAMADALDAIANGSGAPPGP